MIDRHERHSLPLGDAQRERRAAEQAARAAAARLVDASHSQADVARALRLTPRTLGNWMNHSGSPTPRGRPPSPIDPVARTAVNELLDAHGRSVGLPSLKRRFPDVPRAALHDLRDRWDEEHDVEPAHLAWSTPGSVWAADFTETPVPVDGVFDHVLLVRDLASRFILLAAPCTAQSADAVTFHCRRLFRRCGPPLVLKTDNGSPFIAAETRALGRAHGVLNLLSPPLTPQYNGCIEASAGQFKTRAAMLARLHTCDDWTSDILEAARLSANAFGGPRALSTPTPQQQWQARKPIEERRRGARGPAPHSNNPDNAQKIQRQRAEKGLPTEMLAACKATVARTAIRQALVELGFLQIRRPVSSSTQSTPVLSKN
jgi:transposase InsO family protein